MRIYAHRFNSNTLIQSGATAIPLKMVVPERRQLLLVATRLRVAKVSLEFLCGLAEYSLEEAEEIQIDLRFAKVHGVSSEQFPDRAIGRRPCAI